MNTSASILVLDLPLWAEATIRFLTILLGVLFMVFFPRALFATRRPPRAWLLFAFVELYVVSGLFTLIYAQNNRIPVLLYGSPVRLVALVLGIAYLWATRHAFAPSPSRPHSPTRREQ